MICLICWVALLDHLICCNLHYSYSQARPRQQVRLQWFTFVLGVLYVQTPSTQRSSSALVDCFLQLGADTLSQVLLPLLIEDGAAGELALTCSEVKDLCYKGVQKLDLSGLMGVRNPQDLQDWTRDIYCYFPGCTCIQLFLDESVITTPLNVPFLWEGVSGCVWTSCVLLALVLCWGCAACCQASRCAGADVCLQPTPKDTVQASQLVDELHV